MIIIIINVNLIFFYAFFKKIVFLLITQIKRSSLMEVFAIVYTNRETDEEYSHRTDGIFVEIGLEPNSAFLGDEIARNYK